MKDGKMNALLKSSKRAIALLLIGILFYEFLENFTSIMQGVGRFLSVLKPVFWGIAISFIANIPMRLLENRVFKRWKINSLKRALCLTLSVVFILAVVAAAIFLIMPRLVESIRQLAGNFDSYVASVTEWGENLWLRLNLSESVEERLRTFAEGILSRADEFIGDTATAVLKLTVSVAGVVFNLLVALIMSFYALFNKEKLITQTKKLIVAVFDDKRSTRILEVATRTNTALNNYFLGMVIECTILGVLCFIGMSLFHMPFALLISTLVGLTQMVPIIGPWASAVAGAFLILVVDPSRTIWFIILIIAVQQLEENVFYPRVVGNAVGLSGIWVMIAVLLGGGLFGIIGIVLCVPVMAVIYTLVGEWVNKRLEQRKREREEAAETEALLNSLSGEDEDDDPAEPPK